ncbi:T9SS type A sorting domain-containing protein [Larkinella bovis]|uniref:T9SS type A sorting domain-containing protein n=1 Tax=Larkinella bovis TaxID=683041 RepID=A0ABW0ICK2_9BACT
MKTLVKSLLVAFTLTFVGFTAAQADINKPIHQPKKAAAFQSGMYTTTQGKLHIAVDKETGGTVVIRLTDQTGKEVFTQSIAKNRPTARVRLDVSNLPDGHYQVSITNGVETTTQELTLATQQPAVMTRLVAVN